jgi:predicted O-methyltransferase YrrM
MREVTTPMIEQIEEWVKDIPGWSPIDQLYTLFNLVYLGRDLEGDVVEIGSWCGRSTVVLGTAARLIGNTRVFCIDLFPEKKDWRQNPDGSYSFEVRIGNQTYGAYKSQTVWKEPFEKEVAPIYRNHNGIIEVFNETIARNNLQGLVHARKGNSALFARSVKKNFKCKLIFIDGDHGYEAVLQDIENLEPYLVEGGWVCFDDAFSSYEGVDRAINERIIQNPKYELCQQMTRKCFIARKRRIVSATVVNRPSS